MKSLCHLTILLAAASRFGKLTAILHFILALSLDGTIDVDFRVIKLNVSLLHIAAILRTRYTVADTVVSASHEPLFVAATSHPASTVVSYT